MAVYVGDLLTASAAPVSGKPTPTRTWQWLRGSTAISGATSSTYTVAEADLGETLSVKQIETNIAGSAEATSLTVGPVETFTVASLFASGEEGAWYEPSTTTAFLSTTDLTPCGYGDACGFLLDKSQGAGYSGGSFTGVSETELVTNGTFDTDASGWTSTNGSVAVSGGEATLTRSSGSFVYSTLHRSITTEVGKTYYVSAEWRGGTSPKFSIQAGTSARASDLGSSGISDAPPSVGETVDLVFVATGTTTWITVVGDDTALSTTTITFDNISVRELPGNHATQATSSARPILARVPSGGRRNLFTQTEDFTSGDWDSFQNISVSGNRLSVTTTGNAAYIGQLSKTVAGANTNTWEVKYVNNPWVAVNFGAGTATTAFFNIQTGAKGTEAAGYTGTITALSDGWYRISVAGSPGSGAGAYILICDADNDITCTAGRSVDARFPQVEAGSTATAYQKVVSEYDITEAGVTSLDYLAFDGSDDGMATASIDFTATDKISAFAGVEKENEAPVAILAELSARLQDNAGSFYLAVNDGGSNTEDYSTASRGSAALADRAASDDAQAQKIVFSALHDISGDSSILRIDGTQIDEATGDKGTGNFGNYPLNIGARDAAGTASLFLDGKLFSLIVRGAASTAGEISGTESYVANLSGVSL